MKAVPYRKDFIAKLGNGESEEKVLEDMKEHAEVMGQNIDVINEFYSKTGEDKQDRV